MTRTGSPVNEYHRNDRFMAVERLVPERGTWEQGRADFDWDTTCQWRQVLGESERKPDKDSRSSFLQIAPAPRIPRPEPYQVTITWQTDAETPAATYRIVHYGRFKKDGTVVRFTATSRSFRVGS